MTIADEVCESRLDDSTKTAIEYVYKTLKIAKEAAREIIGSTPNAETILAVYDRIIDHKFTIDLNEELDKIHQDAEN